MDFVKRHPAVRIDFLATTRRVDLIAEGFDLALRVGKPQATTLIARRVASQRLIAVAAPEYLRARGHPSDASELARHDCICVSDEHDPGDRWPVVGSSTVRVSGPVTTNDTVMAHNAVLVGMGIGLLPTSLVAADLEAHRLERILETQVEGDAAVNLLFVAREHLAPKVRLFIDMAAPLLAHDCPGEHSP